MKWIVQRFFLVIYLILSESRLSSVVFGRVLKQSSENNLDTEISDLKFVHVVFRHGERTPADTYPKDVYFNETLFPYGWGQLTNVGKSRMYNTGKYLRERYDEFLGDVYLPSSVYAQSTWSDRAHTSCALVLAGLWPPKGTALEWNSELNWTPIPIKSEPLNEDTLLLAQKDCPRYTEELENVQKSVEIKKIVEENLELFERLSNLTGWNISTLNDLQSLYGTLDTEFRYGLKLPDWAEEFYPDKLIDLVKQSYIVNVLNQELKRLKAGPLLLKLIHDWKSIEDNIMKPRGRKFVVYSGHDSTVANILLALGVWDTQIPDYGIMVMFELSQNRNTMDYNVEILLRNSTHIPPYSLTIPGCDRRCPLNKFIELTKNVVPDNWTSECRAVNPGYIPPPIGEP